jgi:transposase InsO family protein
MSETFPEVEVITCATRRRFTAAQKMAIIAEMMQAGMSMSYVAFVLDCHDREAIGWRATTAGISGERIRDMMIECVERRFQPPRTPANPARLQRTIENSEERQQR